MGRVEDMIEMAELPPDNVAYTPGGHKAQAIPPEMHYQAKDSEAKRGSIRMYPSLRLVNPFEPTLDDILIEDIAHHLALENRYAGGSPEPFSVAEHSVRVCRRVRAKGASPSVQLASLLHDSEEAYFKDMPSPIKSHPVMAGYKMAAKHMRSVIFDRFMLDYRLVDASHQADDDEYYRERREMWPLDPLKYVEPWDWTVAEAEFLREFHTIQKDRLP